MCVKNSSEKPSNQVVIENRNILLSSEIVAFINLHFDFSRSGFRDTYYLFRKAEEKSIFKYSSLHDCF